MRILLAGILLLLGGCTSMQWSKDATSNEQLASDLKECQDRAFREAYSRPYGFPTMGPAVIQPEGTGRPFNAYPNSSFSDPYGDRFVEEGRLTSSCMQARGYKMVPAKKS